MSEERINNSVMKCCICNNTHSGEFITIEDKKYHLCCITNLQQENQQLKEECKKYYQDKEILNQIVNETNDKYKSVLDEIREYIERHKVEWIDEKFDEYNEMVKFNEYANPQALLQILDKVKK